MTSTVLFIDNDPLLLKSILVSMRHEHFRVLCVESTEDARLIMDRELIDLVVCDEHMPGTSGSEFLAEIRHSHPRTIRIMLSGQSTVGAVVQAINAGEVFRFLLKPCGHGELLETIRTGLAQQAFLDHCQESLRLFRHQNDLLQSLRESHPDLISAAELTAVAMPPATEDLRSTASLAGALACEIARASGLHRALPAHAPLHDGVPPAPIASTRS